MKKIIAVLMALAMVLAVVACAKPAATETAAAPADQAAAPAAPAAASEPEAKAEGGMKVALVTDVGNIDDKSFNQGAWEGVVAFCEGKGLKQGEGYDYYRPSEDSTEARVETINTAIANGANVVVCPGYLFEDAIFTVQGSNPDVQFLLLDGEPHSADYTTYETT
nr:BMP family ABC transporter substrate-binding protein [Clostridiales bacterium]